MIKEINEIETINKFLQNFNHKIDSLEDPYKKYLGYYEEDEIVGFLNYSLIYDRIEIDYIYVNEGKRKCGIASKLISKLIDIGIDNNSINITLEVNINNEAAINLYLKNGFKKVSIRKNYYNGIDGVLMLRELVKDERCNHFSI